jgi:hypothetical protein
MTAAEYLYTAAATEFNRAARALGTRKVPPYRKPWRKRHRTDVFKAVEKLRALAAELEHTARMKEYPNA